MPVWLAALAASFATAFGKAVVGMAMKLATEEAARWAILKGGEKIVKSTKTEEDDEWFDGLKKFVEK